MTSRSDLSTLKLLSNFRCDALLGNPVFTTQCLAEDLKYYLEQCYVDLCYHMDLEEEYPTECQVKCSLINNTVMHIIMLKLF